MLITVLLDIISSQELKIVFKVESVLWQATINIIQ